MSTTTVVIIPGAWQKPVAWDRFIRELEAAGHKAILVSLPTVGGTELPLKSLEDDVAAVREVLARLAEEKRDALLLCHSAGGLVASAVEGVGNVAGVVYVTAFMVPRGRSLLDMMGGRPFDWMEVLVSPSNKLAPALLPSAWLFFFFFVLQLDGSVTDWLTHSAMLKILPGGPRTGQSRAIAAGGFQRSGRPDTRCGNRGYDPYFHKALLQPLHLRALVKRRQVWVCLLLRGQRCAAADPATNGCTAWT